MSLCLFTVVPGAEPGARHRVDQGGEVAFFLEAVSGVQCHCVCLPLYQALNREQGIEWIKAERLPCFGSY